MPLKSSEGWSLKQGLAAQYAAQAGLDPDLGAAAGEAGWDVLKTLRDAVDEPDPERRAKFLQRVKAQLARSSLGRHRKLAQSIQTKILALQGRGGDTELAHMTPGEVVLPPQLQTPEVMAALQSAAEASGIPLDRITVGDMANNTNPETGVTEFTYSHDPNAIEGITVRGIGPAGVTSIPVNQFTTLPGFGQFRPNVLASIPEPPPPERPKFVPSQTNPDLKPKPGESESDFYERLQRDYPYLFIIPGGDNKSDEPLPPGCPAGAICA